MPIYTKTGDKGETGLFGGGRVGKDHVRIGAYGVVDELNAFVGVARSQLRDVDILDELKRVQNDLFALGADLATPMDSKAAKIMRITPEHTAKVEATIAIFEKELPQLHSFILPGGSPAAATLHVCRTVCRRAERKVVKLSKSEPSNEECIVYLNRLSSLFFELARVVNKRAYINEEEWKG
jgi:cob(I)alamin adenosyltransferase